MPLKVWDSSTESGSYVEAIYNRIISSLPVLTGLAVADVEVDSFFGSSRDGLMSITDTKYFPECIKCTCDILDDLNKNDKGAPITERKRLSLRSIALLLRLLSDLAELNWLSKEPETPRFLKRPGQATSLTSVSGVGSASHRLNYYTQSPDPLPEDLATRAIMTIAKLKSSREIMIKLLELQNKTFKDKVVHHKALIDNIDANVLSIVRFISAANPGEVLKFMQANLAITFQPTSDESDYVPYVDLLTHIQVLDTWLVKYLEIVLQGLDKIRKVIHLQMIIFFSSQSIRFWLMSNPKNFLNNINKESSLPLLANLLFDGCCARMPDFLTSRATSVFACLLLVLSPKTFQEYMNRFDAVPTPHKHSPNTGKQLDFLKSLVKQVTTKGPLVSEYTNCMVTIMFLAGSIKRYDPESALFRFSLLYTDTIFDTLSMADPTKYCVGSDPNVIDDLRVEFVVASTTLLDQKYTQKYTEMLKDPNLSLAALRIVTAGLKALSTNPAAREMFNDILTKGAIELRDLLLRTSEVLKAIDFEQMSSPSTPLIDKGVDKSRDDSLALSLTQSKSSSTSDTSTSTKTTTTLGPISEKSSLPSPVTRTNKKESLSSFRISRHRLDMKKHMNFKLSSGSSTPTLSTTNSSSSSSQLQHTHSNNNQKSNHYITVDVTELAPQYYKDIVKNLFAVFRSQPIAYLLPVGYSVENFAEVCADDQKLNDFRTDLEQIISPFVYLYAEEDAEVVEALTQFTFGIIEKLATSTSSNMATFYYQSSFILMKCLTGLLADCMLDLPKVNKLFGILVLFMESRHKALEELKSNGMSFLSVYHDPAPCQIAFMNLEKAIMAGFLIPDLESFRLVKRSINLLLLDSFAKHKPECFEVMNIDFYKAVAEDNSTLTSVSAYERKIKRLFFDKAHATTGLAVLWIELYERWLTEKEADKHNYLAFIVSMAGVFITPENEDQSLREDVIEKIKFVISSQMEILTLDDFKLREAAKDILSAEMSPASYKYVVSLMHEKTKEIMAKPVPSDKDLLLIDQFTLISRLFIQADTIYVYILMVEMLNLFHDWARIVDLAEDEVMKLKLKLKNAKLGQFIDAYKTKYSNWGMLKLRNYFARVYLDWTESALFRVSDAEPKKVISVGSDSSKALKPQNPRKAKELDMLALDVGVECSSVLAMLLEKNPLETPQAIHAKEFKRSRRMIFGNYFSVLYRILDKYNSLASADETPLSVKHKISALIENTVTGLINLLDANVDVGFEFAIPLNFHKDRRIKLSFLKVFATIVNRLNINDDGSLLKNAAIEQTIRNVMDNPNLTLAVVSVCPASDIDSLALTFLNGDDDQLKVLNVLSTLIKLEIMTAKNSSEILRSNSVATRMLALFCKKEGFDYLERALKPTLSKIADAHDNFEVEKLTLDDPLAQENVDKFMFYLNELVNLLFESIEYIPNELKYLCSVIYEATGKVFPDAKIYAVGAFIFLRLIAPAIVSPDANGIISVSTGRALKRSFIQLAKVLQLMANSSITSIRWPLLLSRMNELTIMNVQITRFLQSVSKFHPKQDIIRRENNSTQVDTTFFHHLIYDHLGQIRHNFMADKTLTMQEKREVYTAFDAPLCGAGQPHSLFGYSLKNFLDGKEQDSSLYEFMTKTSMKEINFTVRDNIAHETISADGIPTVVLNYPCLENSAFEDAELVMFRFYQVASKIWDSKFYLVLDCTGFVSQKDFIKSLFTIFEAYTPQSLIKNLSRIYFYNVCQKYLPEFCESIKFMQDCGYKDVFHFASSFDSGNFGFGLSLQTTSINEDVRVTFNDVSLYEPSQKRFVPVTVRIGDEYLQIGSKQPFRFKAFGTMKTLTVTDVYSIGDLTGAEISNITGVPDEICITNSSDGSRLIMTSPKKIEIIRTLYFSKSRYNANLQKQKEEDEDESHDLGTWFGELINIDFVGLLSRDEEVRRASYVLLCALGKSFQLDLGTYVQSSSEVCFPQNNISFVISNAKILAEKHTEYTYEIVSGFFNAYKHAEEYQHISAIMYISPFIKHLFSALENELESRREEKTSSLIKKFIEVSTLQEGTLVAFHAHVWTQLSLQDKVADLLIEEAVAASIDREAEGKRWDDIISLVTMTPTLKICASVIERLKSLSNIAKLNSEDSIATHTSWIEITVLMKICVALFFDSTLFTEMYMSDILYIATIFMDVGPLELRTALYKLLLNVFHSALLREDFEPEKRERAMLIVNRFQEQRIKMLFGLNREGNRISLLESEGDIFNRISALEILCDSLFEFIHLVGDEEIVCVWRSRWHGLAVDAAFNEDSMLQDRAFLILGFLCKHGVVDLLIDKILRSLVSFAQNIVDKKSFNSVLCAIYALSRAVQGIPPKSLYSEKFYWLAMILNYNSNILLAHASIQLLGNALVSVDKRGKFINGDFIKGIFENRAIFGRTIELYENRYGIQVIPENLDLVLICIYIRDLKAPFTKAVALESLKSSFSVRVNNAVLREKLTGNKSDGHCLIYAVILYVASSSNSSFMDAVADTDLGGGVTDISEGIKVPTKMLDFLLQASDQAILTLRTAALYISSDASDEKGQIRFLVLFRYLAAKSARIKWLIYPQIRPSLRVLSKTMTSPLLLSLVFGISKDAIVCAEYDNVPQYIQDVEELVDQYHLRGVQDMSFLSSHAFQVINSKEIPSDITREGVQLLVEITQKIISAVTPNE